MNAAGPSLLILLKHALGVTPARARTHARWLTLAQTLMVLCLLVLFVAPSPSRAEAPAHKGVAVVIGGALSHRNDEVWSRVVALSGGKGATWLVIPTASGSPESSAKRIIESLEKHGATAQMVPLSKSLKDFKVEDVVRDPVWIARVRAAKGIYFAGGAQEHITEALYQRVGERIGDDVKNTPMLDAIWAMYREGGVVAGSSAGAAIMSATMFRDPPDNLTILRSGVKVGRDIDRGLGFVGDTLFVDQHFLKRGRIGRLLPVMAQTGFKVGLGIEEDSAAVVSGSNVEIIGAKGALLVDLRTATSNRAQNTASNTSIGGQFQPFLLQGARISYLDRGDSVNLASMVVTPSASKLKGSTLDHTAPNFKPYNKDVRFHADILGDGTIVNAMAQLLDSPKMEARGLAFSFSTKKDKSDIKREEASDIGFEFRLYKRADTTGYFSTALGGDDYTIISMGLDVIPVRLASPLYVPLNTRSDAESMKAGENRRLDESKASRQTQPSTTTTPAQ
jgi:cyanophycinase